MINNFDSVLGTGFSLEVLFIDRAEKCPCCVLQQIFFPESETKQGEINCYSVTVSSLEYLLRKTCPHIVSYEKGNPEINIIADLQLNVLEQRQGKCNKSQKATKQGKLHTYIHINLIQGSFIFIVKSLHILNCDIFFCHTSINKYQSFKVRLKSKHNTQLNILTKIPQHVEAGMACQVGPEL